MIPKRNHITVNPLGQGPGFVFEVFFNIFFDGLFGLNAKEVLFSPCNEFFPGEGNLIDVELISVEKLRQDVEILDFVFLLVFKFLVVAGPREGMVEPTQGVTRFGNLWKMCC